MKKFHGFYGQGPVVAFVRSQLLGAKALGKPMPHTLIGGSSGMGKTKLAESMAKEYGSTLHRVLGRPSLKQVCEYIVMLETGDFLFMDEAHNLKRDVQELLYEYIDSFKVRDKLEGYEPDGAKISKDKNGKLVIQPSTLILATDKPGTLLEALLRRVKHRVTLVPYENNELEEIGRATATRIGLLVSDLALRKIATASQGQPRRAEQILEGIQLYFHKSSHLQVKTSHVEKYLEKAGIDKNGLDPLQQLYLRNLGRYGQVGLETLSHKLDCDMDYVKSQVEPGLKRKDFIIVTKAGRELTTIGREWWSNYKKRNKK